jgi:membrane-bound lytic murein transglycosylase MltF
MGLVACGESATPDQEVSKTAANAEVASTAAPGVEGVPADVEATVADQPLAEEKSIEKSIKDLEEQMGLKIFRDPWTGDLDVMMEQRVIRVLTVYGLGRYYLDGPDEKGITYDWFKMFEEFVNRQQKIKHVKTHVVFVPVARDQLIPALLEGRGDIVAAGVTITPERLELIDFSDPVTKELSEILVTGPGAPQLDSLADLAGHSVYVRASSSYRSSLDALNREFGQQGLELIEIEDAPEQLEDDDILEMVNSGMLNWAVVDDYKARDWSKVFANLTIRDDLVFRAGGRLGLGFRKNSPLLEQELNEFVKTHKQGTLHGNILVNRYFKNFDWSKNALAASDYQRFRDVAEIFEKYGEQYGVDYLMVAAQGYQESRLDQSARSSAGAIGIMQLLPSTAADPNVGIDDISDVESNIHAGIKYLDFIRKRYFSDSGMDVFNQTMFAFAAYNAGPARVRRLRTMAEQAGYDPNLWFDNVEIMAARDIGRETVQYVANILKYYLAYSFSVQRQLEREQIRREAGLETG